MICNMLANIGFSSWPWLRGVLDRHRSRHYGAPRFGSNAAEAGIGLGQPPRMSEDPPPDPLARLSEQIDRARAERLRQEASGRGGPPRGALGLGLRMATELAAALIVGLALGWVVDRVFGTRPWALIIFFFLGVAAGMVNVFRSARGVGSPTTPRPTRNDDRPGQD
jgi:ATP synthase protein I